MQVIEVIFIGAFATAALDLWQVALCALGGPPPSNWGLIGRWVSDFHRGQFTQPAHVAVAPYRQERIVGWCFHYGVGVTYAALFVALLDALKLPASLVVALTFSLALVVAPWFIMQPALGLGVMAARTAKPWQSRAATLASHFAFGFGLHAAKLLVMRVA